MSVNNQYKYMYESFFNNILVSSTYGIPVKTYWVVSFYMEDDYPFNGNFTRDPKQWNCSDKARSAIYEFINSGTTSMLVQGIKLPGESIMTSRQGAEHVGGFPTPLTTGKRREFQPLEITFLENNSSIVDFVIRPWLIDSSYASLKYAKKATIICNKLVPSHKGFVTQKIFTFYNAVPVYVDDETLKYKDDDYGKRQTQFIYTNYIVSDGDEVPVEDNDASIYILNKVSLKNHDHIPNIYYDLGEESSVLLREDSLTKNDKNIGEHYVDISMEDHLIPPVHYKNDENIINGKKTLGEMFDDWRKRTTEKLINKGEVIVEDLVKGTAKRIITNVGGELKDEVVQRINKLERKLFEYENEFVDYVSDKGKDAVHSVLPDTRIDNDTVEYSHKEEEYKRVESSSNSNYNTQPNTKMKYEVYVVPTGSSIQRDVLPSSNNMSETPPPKPIHNTISRDDIVNRFEELSNFVEVKLEDIDTPNVRDAILNELSILEDDVARITDNIGQHEEVPLDDNIRS